MMGSAKTCRRMHAARRRSGFAVKPVMAVTFFALVFSIAATTAETKGHGSSVGTEMTTIQRGYGMWPEYEGCSDAYMAASYWNEESGPLTT